MNILHIILANPFTESMTYQENLLANQNVLDGHKVTIIANCEQFSGGEIVKCPKERKVLDNNITLIRLDYDNVINRFFTSKVRKSKALRKMIDDIKPDVIFFHSLSTWELYTAAQYKKEHPEVKLITDTHADYYTSATNKVSKIILHGGFYRKIIHDCLKYIDKFFYISVDCGEFLKEVYRVPMEKAEFYPLGGYVSSNDEKELDAANVRKALGIKDEELFLIHAGKLDKQKKTLELIEAFRQIELSNVRLVIVGSISKDIEKEFYSAINNDSRIIYDGWKSAEELVMYLNACDLYLQPGKVSAIAANAICSGVAVILKDIPDYKPFIDGNGWLINDTEEIINLITQIAGNREKLEEMKLNSRLIAERYLDYKTLAKRMYKL